MRSWQIGLLGYLAIAVVTFGYAAETRDRRLAQVCPSGTPATEISRDCHFALPGSVTGLIAGAAWPLYWSWEIWSTADD